MKDNEFDCYKCENYENCDEAYLNNRSDKCIYKSYNDGLNGCMGILAWLIILILVILIIIGLILNYKITLIILGVLTIIGFVSWVIYGGSKSEEYRNENND